jgi:hypothetical protein
MTNIKGECRMCHNAFGITEFSYSEGCPWSDYGKVVEEPFMEMVLVDRGDINLTDTLRVGAITDVSVTIPSLKSVFARAAWITEVGEVDPLTHTIRVRLVAKHHHIH